MTKDDDILQELKKIREAVEKAPAPPAPKGFWNEFKDFLSKYKVLGLAIGFIIGLYLGTLVQSLVADLLLPAIGVLIPGLDNLATMIVTAAGQNFGVGNFLVALITFIIVAIIAFIITKMAKKMKID